MAPFIPVMMFAILLGLSKNWLERRLPRLDVEPVGLGTAESRT